MPEIEQSFLTLMNIAEVLDASPELVKVFPQYRPRPEQSQLAQSVQQALDQSRHCLAEAGTGVGKSLAYLLPGIDWSIKRGVRLVVSTHTKALQSQLVRQELPRLQSAGLFIRPFRFALCLGVENYVCVHRLLQAAGQEALPGCDPEYLNALQQLMAWCRGEGSGIRLDAPFAIPDRLWYQICSIKALCLGKACAYFSECYWQSAKQEQWAADILVTNHSLFFSHLASGGHLLADFGAVILDEAHKVEDTASQFLGADLQPEGLRAILDDLTQKSRNSLWARFHRLAPAEMERISQQAQAVRALQDPWWQALPAYFLRDTDTVRFTKKPPQLSKLPAESLRLLAEQVNALAAEADSDEAQKLAQYFGQRLQMSAEIQLQWLEQSQERSVYWAERTRSFSGLSARIYITPLDLDQRLQTLLFLQVPAVILTSATLAVGGDFEYARTRLGVPQPLEIIVNSPFDYATRTLLYLPARMPDPKAGEAFEQAVLQHAAGLVEIFAGGVFVLCTSYRLLKQAAVFLRERFPEMEVLAQGEAASGVLLDRFRANGHAVLLGVETFWQGVDVPGNALRCVIITRLPFDVPTHPVHQARSEAYNQRGENAFRRYAVPRAVLMLKQGFGRLIRRHEDCGVVAILDPRVQSREWGRRFLQALPDCRRTANLTEVADFVRQHFTPYNDK